MSMRKMALIWIGPRIPGDRCPLMVPRVLGTVPQSVKYFFAFNDLKLISGWSVWLILKTNIHLITINNHLSGDRRSLARVWIFKSVQCAWSRWSSLWSPKKMKIWRIQKNRVSAESENVLWFVRQHDFNAKNCEISKILSCHSVSTQVFAWKPAPIWLVLKIRAYLGMPFTIISA